MPAGGRCCWDRALQAAEVGPEQRMGRTLCDLGPATDPSWPQSSYPCSGGDESHPTGLWGRWNDRLATGPHLLIGDHWLWDFDESEAEKWKKHFLSA